MALQTADLVIIGAGPAGFSAAFRAASLGAKVVLIEDAAAGGVCLHSGCIPMLANTTGKKSPRQITSLVAMLQRSLENHLAKAGICLVNGKGKLTGERTVSVGKKNFVANKGVLIATGCKQILPNNKRFISIADFFALDSWPNKVSISGAGTTGCEFATFLANRGIQVSLYEKDKVVMPNFCSVVSANVKSGLEHAGVKVFLGKKSPSSSLCTFGHLPATQNLGLDTFGVALSSIGAIKTDNNCRTNLPWLYAAGDVRDASPRLASTAMAEGEAIANTLFSNNKTSSSRHLFPRTARTNPPVAEVGNTTSAMQCVWFPFAQLGAAWALGCTEGGVAWYFSKGKNVPSGAVAIGENADHMIAAASVMIEVKLKFDFIASLPRIHPSLSEAWQECASLCQKETSS